MRLKTVLYFVCMIGIAIVLAAWMKSRRTEARAGSMAAEQRFVFTAASDLPAGAFIEERQFNWRLWDESLGEGHLREAYVASETALKELSGSVLKVPKKAGEALAETDVVLPGDFAFLSAVLTPGSRAISIRTDDVSGSAGLIFPGNRVDVILSGPLDNKGANSRTGTPVARTIITDVKVIAINRRMENAPADTANTAPAKSGRPGEKGTATLEVTPKQAELLAVAKTMGDLSLSLRSLIPAEHEKPDDPLSITKSNELIPENRARQNEEAEIVMMYGSEIRR